MAMLAAAALPLPLGSGVEGVTAPAAGASPGVLPPTVALAVAAWRWRARAAAAAASRSLALLLGARSSA